MKCGRPRPLWAPTAEGVFLSPRRLQERGVRVAGARRKGRAPRGRGEMPGLRRRDGARLRGAGAPFRPTSSTVGCEVRGTHVGGLRGGLTVRRLRSAGAPLRVTSSAAVGRVRGIHVDYLRGGVHGAAGAGVSVRRFGRLHRPLWGEVRGTYADCLRGGAHGAAGVGEEAGVSVSQKRSRSNRSASASSPPASARARAWSTS